LIGRAVAARLNGDGHTVIGTSREPVYALPFVQWVRLDLRNAESESAWLPHLKNVDAVINCAGVLQDSYRDSTVAAHATGPGALYRACGIAGIRKVIHISAIGVDRGTPTAFSQSKWEGDKALMASMLDWVILRPSVVLGRGAYGGSALFRGLAALPIIPRVQGGELQVVQLDDLVATVAFFLRPEAPARIAVEIAGPERLAFDDVVATYRAWLGWPPARRIPAPHGLFSVIYRLGDLAGRLGWRPPVRSTAGREMARGATGDPAEWTALTGIVPQSLNAALNAEPATVQEKWFARLYLLKPLALGVFALFWIVTAFISLGPGWDAGMSLLREGGFAGQAAAATIIAGALADLLIGLGIAWRRTTRAALWSALALSLAYLVIGTLLVPLLWIDPLGSLLKVWPVLALNLLLLAILEER
jgi:uncharacterized protein YbjT (DUF2867 family)